jgi:hypothetical protein
VPVDTLWWPAAEELAGWRILAGNQAYEELTWLSWNDVVRLVDLETTFIERIDGSATPSE